MKSAAEIRVGISGWTYAPWRGVFFPKGWPQKRELEYAARQLSSIEINGSFYSLQRPEHYRAWYKATPPGFVFSVKGSRFITHIRRLADVGIPLANFFASGLLCLREKLGPILWQMPPSFRYNRERLAAFFELLPRDTLAAGRLARGHDDRVKGRAAVRADEQRPIRHALEIRHASFETPEFVELLREHDIALVVADTAGKWPLLEDLTSDFVYMRLHGDEEIYTSGYTAEALECWAKKIESWAKGRVPRSSRRVGPPGCPRRGGRDVYVYFDNDVKVRAPFDAMALGYQLGLRSLPAQAPAVHPIKESARISWPEVKRQWHAV